MSDDTVATPPEAPVTTEVQWRLPHDPRSAGRARELLRGQLAAWGVDGDLADTAGLLLSELMSNAIRHARTPAGREIGVRVARCEGRLRVEVADAGRTRPVPREAAADDEQGRGLAIISALATRWGCCPRRHGIGKAVWAELPMPPPFSPGG
ncbi:ATP-binding protein [Streptomyces sp. NRRL S-31]|uniref:ATP-binding protein n=1 Tax=Streptomyces sp. NRRL S-31 TaxID=1463898 RepID=UPI0009A0C7E2|nr:ATP-binding protein [Streptomyces sp. NRRL S-31]